MITRSFLICGRVLFVAIATVSLSAAQTAPWRVVQASDGTLYLVTGDTRYVINPDPISDDDLAALNDGGTQGSQLPMPTPRVVTQVVTATPVPLPPIAALPTSTPVPVPAAPAVAESPVTITGSGNQNSRPFSLRGGNYTVDWTFTATGGKSCFAAGASLHGVDNIGSASFGGRSTDIAAGQNSSGETQAYNLAAGQYYIAAFTSCAWSVTVKPQ